MGRARRQSIYGLIQRMRHPELLRALVHHADHRLDRAADLFCDCHCGVVGRFDQRCLHQFAKRIDVALLEADARTAGMCRAFRDSDRVIAAETARVDLLLRDQQIHHLGHRSRRPLHVGVVGHQHAAAVGILEQRALVERSPGGGRPSRMLRMMSCLMHPAPLCRRARGRRREHDRHAQHCCRAEPSC